MKGIKYRGRGGGNYYLCTASSLTTNFLSELLIACKAYFNICVYVYQQLDIVSFQHLREIIMTKYSPFNNPSDLLEATPH